MNRFLKLLSRPGIIISDGATGTQLQKAGLPAGVLPEVWNLENPAAIRRHYESYVAAGSDFIASNTFGGNRPRLQQKNLENRLVEINRRGVELAREVLGDTALLAGDMGPTGQLLEPLGELTYQQAVEAFAEQAKVLEESGVDALLIETMSDLQESKAAIEGCKKASSLPVMLTMSFDTRGRTMMGVKPEDAVRELWALDITATGANCGRTLSETLAAITAMRQAQPEAVLIAQPNAGLPRTEGEEIIYDVTPEIMTEYALKFAEQNIKIFGGCCGSTPEHIRAARRALLGPGK